MSARRFFFAKAPRRWRRRFGPVRESYAHEKYGDTRNVGVIGIAIFNESGTSPWIDREVQKRLHAKPFPGRFATPP
jgi:hypothetical protein